MQTTLTTSADPVHETAVLTCACNCEHNHPGDALCAGAASNGTLCTPCAAQRSYPPLI